MSAEVEKKAVSQEEAPKTGFAKLMTIAEFKMVVYVVPVALVLLVIALLLGK